MLGIASSSKDTCGIREALLRAMRGTDHACMPATTPAESVVEGALSAYLTGGVPA